MNNAALFLLLAAIPGAAPTGVGPPIDITRPVAHDVAMSIDVGPARDILVLLSAKPGASAALKRLQGSHALTVALSRDGGNPEDVLGRLVSVAAGTPDPVFSSYVRRAGSFAKVLDACETDGTRGSMVEARRIAALLPASTRVTARLTVVPLLAIGGFQDVVAETDGTTTWLFVDLARLVPEEVSEVVPREVVLSLLREVAAEAWRRLFAPFRVPPGWPEEKDPGFDALLGRTVAEGPATMFLFPDEFFPLGTMFEEPISRSFARWNETAARLLDPKAKEGARQDALAGATARGDFWSHDASVVGAKLTETILLRAGNGKYLEALAAGPRAVASLYLDVTKKTKEPSFGKAARAALESKPAER